MKPPPRLRPLFVLTVLIAVLLAGCAPPDRWSLLEPDYEQRFQAEPDRSVEIPEKFQVGLERPMVEPAVADGVMDLSVEQVTMLALANNRDLLVQRLNPVIAGTFEQIERGVYDPELFAEFEYSEERASETSRSAGTKFNVEGRDSSAAAGFRQQLPTGTAVEAAVEQDLSVSNRAPEQQTARLGLSVTQSLLRGFGPGHAKMLALWQTAFPAGGLFRSYYRPQR